MRMNAEPGIITYLHSKGRRLGLPISGSFELTARCNFNCPMCYVHLTQEQVNARGRELTAQQWLQIAREARDEGMVFALLTGGEPLIRKDFFEIYHGMKQLGLMVSINSNGSMLSGENLERILEEPPLRINISLYGGSSATYEAMCGQNAFDRVVENIRTLRQAGINVSLNLSITPYNVHDLERLHAIAQELGVRVRVAGYMYPPVRVNGQYGSGNRLSPEDAAGAVTLWNALNDTPEKFEARARSLKALCPVEEPECAMEVEEGIRCRAGSSSFWMTWDGIMRPCGMFTEPDAYPLEVGFRDAWKYIREQAAAVRTPAKCVSCPKRPVCGVCAAVCKTETGAYDQVPEYACRQTDALIEKTWDAYLRRKAEEHED